MILISFVSCKGQNNVQNSEALISSLTNEQVIIKINYFISYSIDSSALQVINLQDKKKVHYLLKNLSDKDKALVTHIILTKMFEPKKDKFKYEYIYDGEGNITKTIYSINNLNWIRDEVTTKNIIENYDAKKLFEYWSSHIKE